MRHGANQLVSRAGVGILRLAVLPPGPKEQCNVE